MNEWRKDLDKDFDKPFCALSRELDVSEMVVRGGEVSIYLYLSVIFSNPKCLPSPPSEIGSPISSFTALMLQNMLIILEDAQTVLSLLAGRFDTTKSSRVG